MSPSDIRAEADLSEYEEDLVEDIVKKYAGNWEQDKRGFRIGVIATLAYFKSKEFSGNFPG